MTTSIKRHLDAATMLSFAAGTLSESLAAVVAAHIAICPECRDELADIELLGEALLMGMPCDREGRMAAPRRPSDPLSTLVRSAVAPLDATADLLPAPIIRTYGLTFSTIPWRRLGPGVWHHRLALRDPDDSDLRLLKIAAGRKMPEHGHGGTELTLVIDGVYADESGSFARGDVQDVDEGHEHSPVADPDVGCVCLIASERPARFKGLLGRFVHPLTGL